MANWYRYYHYMVDFLFAKKLKNNTRFFNSIDYCLQNNVPFWRFAGGNKRFFWNDLIPQPRGNLRPMTHRHLEIWMNCPSIYRITKNPFSKSGIWKTSRKPPSASCCHVCQHRVPSLFLSGSAKATTPHHQTSTKNQKRARRGVTPPNPSRGWFSQKKKSKSMYSSTDVPVATRTR